MSNATYNANRTNRITAARRRNPAAAGYDDGYSCGFDLGFANKPLRGASVVEYADPRWRKDRTYRAAFERAAREAHAIGVWTYEDTQIEKMQDWDTDSDWA